MRDAMEALRLPYRIFGFDFDISELIMYAKSADAWMKDGGRTQLAAALDLNRSSTSGLLAPRRAPTPRPKGISDVQARHR